MNRAILVRFGDLVLKGKNKPAFIKQIKEILKQKLRKLNVKFEYQHDRIFVHFDEIEEQQVLKQLTYVSGVHSYSFIYKTEKDLDKIAALSLEVIQIEMKFPSTFKVETKRIDKTFLSGSLEVSQRISGMILPKLEGVTVDVKNPEQILNIEIRLDAAYIYMGKIMGLGGFPIGLGPKSLVMLSGGIDSPVAAYLMMKKGIEVELFHFESTPLTPLESVQKVIDISKKLSKYMPNDKIKLHLVPFTKIHEDILKFVEDSYIITIMRRIFYRMGERFAIKNKLDALINGESIGQVASQTLGSLKVVESVTTLPILRPLITYDKNPIIDISKVIETYDISVRPFNDCCSIYVPQRPVTNPTIEFSLKQEEKLVDLEALMMDALNHIKTLEITPETDLEIALHGFDVREALNNL
ncbi:Probable tRNA sulfurtransferase [Acholeplasma oculi]|uniref:Probable tRNA sulfurtransferase n=1 Tax=Acholeplasma oculi TaxID=35623 RepID=A0A061A909_9MOLU|nr:tRNA uracil 4-sulfurtransferase ThiI [Acholeplasma oculi]CDR30370.1 tRNA sulfurtransferase ThiI [Acholeplasma oculi]SKC42180.1 thiamine biosynthesis protein ThiI [Acholeplasma oculi]SUT88886.1 Probable tRNA sulfurtransferase [Acholeplasma oculi]